MINLQELQTELTNATYNGLTDAEAVVKLSEGTLMLGRIEGANRRNLITLVNSGLRRRLLKQEITIEGDIETEKSKTVPDVTTLTTLDGVLKLTQAFIDTLDPILIMQPEFSINLGDPTVKGMFDQAFTYGVITDSEKNTVELIASYYADSIWKGVREKDVYIARNALIGEGIVNYNYNHELTYIVNGRNDRVNVNVKLATPSLHDVNAVISFSGTSSDHTDVNSYVPFDQKFTVTIKAGTNGNGHVFNTDGLPRFLKANVKLDMNVEANVDIGVA